MEPTPIPQQKISSRRYYALSIIAFVVVLIILLIVGSNISDPAGTEEVRAEMNTATTTQFARSAPTTLRIPALDVETSFEAPLGLNEDKTIEVPDTYTQVGWYKHGPTPGEIGPAVVLGHVDSYEGPAVFWPLKELEAGDEVYIEREDGTTATFIVTHQETYNQNNFPTELVYGPTEDAELRLVTCTGTYSHGTQRYSHNLVVYATLQDPA